MAIRAAPRVARGALPERAPTARAPRRSGRRSISALVIFGVLGLLLVLPTLAGGPASTGFTALGFATLPAYRVNLDAVLQSPSLAHPLGTDETGRDALARLLVGAQATLSIGAGGAALAVFLGTLLGASAGYAGGAPGGAGEGGRPGWIGGTLDAVLMRFVDFALAFPSLFAILLFTSFFKAGPLQLVVLIGLTGWMPVARLVRGSVRELLHAPYVEAARAVGASRRRIVLRHLLPNTGGVLFVAALIQLNRAVLAEATISFLGLGIQPPDPTWGNLLIGAQVYLYSAPWLAVAPGLAITLTLLAVYSLGIQRAVGPRATA